MTATDSGVRVGCADAFGTVREWVEADPPAQAALIGAPGVRAPFAALEARVEAVRRLGGACRRVELSPHVRSLAKMVGALEMRIE
jgi:hypothetical protein